MAFLYNRSMSNKTTYTVTHTIAYCPCAMEAGATAYSGTGRAKSRSLLRAMQRARKLAREAEADSLRAVIAQGREPAMTPVLDDSYVYINGEYAGPWCDVRKRLETPFRSRRAA